LGTSRSSKNILRKVKQQMKVGITAIIIKRLEVPWLDEWIAHHLSLGFEKIVIYDNGNLAVDDGKWCVGARKLKGEEEGKWIKKPDAEYFEEYSDDQIEQMFLKIQDKYQGVLEVIPWVYIKHHNYTYPTSQYRSINDCFNKYPDYWWASIDPDEYFIFFEDETIQQLMARYPGKECFTFTQRVFDERNKKKSVREVLNWDFDQGHQFNPKRILKGPIEKVKFSHWLTPKGRSPSCKIWSGNVNVPKNLARYNHYRGNPLNAGGQIQMKYRKKYLKGRSKDECFTKVDKTMEKYL